MKSWGICAGMVLLVMPAVAEETAETEAWMLRSNAIYSPHEVAQFGTAEQMAHAVAAEPAQINAVDETGNTPLHLAVKRGSADVVQVLLEYGADVAAHDAAGLQPKDYARQEPLIRLLQAAAQSRNNELQLYRDIKAGRLQAVQAALAAGVNPNAWSADRQGPLLCIAVQTDDAEIVRALLKAGADANYVWSDTHKSMLHLAAVVGSESVIRVLLEYGANILHPGNNGATPLHDAIWHRNTPAVKALLPAYATLNFSPDGHNLGYPIVMAIRQNCPQYVQMMLAAGLKVNDARFAHEPLLHVVAKYNRADIVDMLLRAGADPHALDKQGKKAHQYAKAALAEVLKSM